jgi:hypothetical protein
LAAIEAHKAAVTAGEAAYDRYSALEEELHRNGRLRKSDRTKDETRRADEIDDEVQRAYIAEAAAAIALLGADETTQSRSCHESSLNSGASLRR